jgi:outer membrane protein assembly factor BamB
MTLRLPLIAAALLFASAALADDWPTFRGPNRDGVCKETGLLQAWPKQGPPKVWTVSGLGIGFGTPIVADGKIFGLGTIGGKEVVWALNEADGSVVWTLPIDDPRPKTNQNNGPSGSPTYDAGRLYAVSSKGRLVCVQAKDGKLLWKKEYLADFGAKGLPAWAFTDTPLVDGDHVICVPTSAKAAVAALKKDTGKVVWQTEVPGGVGDGAGYSSVVKATLAGKPMYVVLLGNKAGVVGINPENGKLLWQYNAKPATGGVAQVPMPVVYKNHVWVSSSYSGGAALLEISADGTDRFTVKELKKYSKPELNNHHGGMVQVGEYVYFGHNQNDGNPVCVDLNTGEIKWGPERNPAGGAGSAAVLYADGRLYFRYQNHVLVLIEPSPEQLKVISSFRLPEPSSLQSWPHPVIANGKLYIRDQDKLHCFNVKADKS